MKNLILRKGNKVRYLFDNSDLTEMGFELGEVYEVFDIGGKLMVLLKGGAAGAVIVDAEGELTEVSDYFGKLPHKKAMRRFSFTNAN